MEKERMKAPKSTIALTVGITALIFVAVIGIGAALYFNGDSYHMRDIKKDIAQAEEFLAEENYEEALEILKAGLERYPNNEKAKALLGEKEAEIYRSWANKYLSTGEYLKAYYYVQNGIDETGNPELTDFKAQIYLTEIESRLQKKDVANALRVLRRGATDIPDAPYQDEWEETYRILSDYYLEEGDCVSAVQTLMDGVEDIGADALAEREAYLRENIVYVKKTIITKETPYTYGWITVHEYDKAGNEIKCTDYFSDGKIASYDEYEYDEAGNKTKRVTYNSVGEIKKLTEYEYDESGNQIVTSTDYEYGNVISYWYNKSGNVIKHINYAPDGSVVLCDEYDGEGNLVKAARYEGGALYQWRESEYDEAGNLIKGTWYYYGNITSWDEYEYNEEGKMIKKIYHEVYYKDYYKDSWYEYQYNDAGNLIWEIHYVLDEDGGYYESGIEYDEAGRMIRFISYKDNGEIYDKAKCEYDEAGNKTRHILYNKDGTRTEWEIDKEGRKARETNYNAYGKLKDVKEGKYNIFGDVITDLDGKTYSYEYIYLGE